MQKQQLCEGEGAGAGNNACTANQVKLPAPAPYRSCSAAPNDGSNDITNTGGAMRSSRHQGQLYAL